MFHLRGKKQCIIAFAAWLLGMAWLFFGDAGGLGGRWFFLPCLVLLELVLLKVGLFRLCTGFWRRRIVGLARGASAALLGVIVAQLCVFGLAGAWLYLAEAGRVLADPMALNAMEGRETVKAWLMTHGVGIYPSMAGYPFLVTIYPPLYHAAVAAVAAVTSSEWSIAPSRLVSMGAFLLTVAAAGILARKRGWGWAAVMAVILLIFLDPTLREWSMHARPDGLAWLLALCGAGVFWLNAGDTGGRPASIRACVLSGVFLALALFTKQQTLPYLLACLIWGAGRFKRGIKPLLAMAAGVLGICTLGAGGLEWATGGYFLRDVALYPVLMGRAASVSTMEFLITRSLAVWNIYWPIILLFAAAVLHTLTRREWNFPVILALVNAAFMLKLLASWGADINYAFGFVLPAMLAVAGLLDRLAMRSPYGLPAVLLLLVLLPPATPWRAWSHWADAPSPAVLTHREQAAGLASLPGSILVNTEGGHLFLGERTGRRVIFFDGIETQLYELSGLWKSKDSELVEDIRLRRFDTLALYGDFLPQGVRDAAAWYYDRPKTVDHYGLYSPKSASGIAVLDAALTFRSDPGLAVMEVDTSTLNPETEGLAPLDRSKPGVLSLKARASKGNGRMEAAFSLRVDPKDSMAGARWSVLDASGRELAAGSATEKGLAASRVTASLQAPNALDALGGAFELRIVLTGNAWIVPVNDALVALYTYP